MARADRADLLDDREGPRRVLRDRQLRAEQIFGQQYEAVEALGFDPDPCARRLGHRRTDERRCRLRFRLRVRTGRREDADLRELRCGRGSPEMTGEREHRVEQRADEAFLQRTAGSDRCAEQRLATMGSSFEIGHADRTRGAFEGVHGPKDGLEGRSAELGWFASASSWAPIVRRWSSASRRNVASRRARSASARSAIDDQPCVSEQDRRIEHDGSAGDCARDRSRLQRVAFARGRRAGGMPQCVHGVGTDRHGAVVRGE